MCVPLTNDMFNQLVYSFNELDLKEKKKYNDEYSSPEQFYSNFDIDQSADFWSLAISIYKMLTSKYPFNICAIFEEFEGFPEKSIEITENAEIDSETKELLSDLLKFHENERLGSRENFSKIKDYLFFNGIDWLKVENGEMNPPFNPNYNVTINYFINQNLKIEDYKIITFIIRYFQMNHNIFPN